MTWSGEDRDRFEDWHNIHRAEPHPTARDRRPMTDEEFAEYARAAAKARGTLRDLPPEDDDREIRKRRAIYRG